jgi:hypothetical protein
MFVFNRFFGSTLVNAVENAIDKIKDETMNIIQIGSAIVNPGQNNQPGEAQDPCATTCFIRVIMKGEPKDFFYDQPNGCIAKGVNDNDVNSFFGTCCDNHNRCLNAQCCTNNCQELKNACDEEYFKCTRSACKPLYDDEIKFYTCQAKASYMVSGARNNTCKPGETTNRKLCRC